MKQRSYLCIDQKSFYASVECVLRGLDPMKAKLVVADPERSRNTICLAVSPALKALGVKNRCRIGDIPPNLKYIIAPPQMQMYIDYAAEIHKVYLKYVAPEDIHVYSIDESFLDVTAYLKMYQMSSIELAKMIMQETLDHVGTISTCGIGPNLYLAKIALDIISKHAPDFIGILDEESYRRLLWDHMPITDFWRISTGTAARLRNHGITTMRGIAEADEDLLYRLFGIDAELLIDHAWGKESTTIADIKAYHSKSKSVSSGQVLMRDYKYEEGLLVTKEAMDQLCLDLAAKKLATRSLSLYIGYSYTQGIPGAGGTAKLSSSTNVPSILMPTIIALYKRIVDPRYVIRRVCICCNDVEPDPGILQLNMFEDVSKQIRDKTIQETVLGIRAKYGKNSILKGINLDEAGTQIGRNQSIGGHKSGV